MDGRELAEVVAAQAVTLPEVVVSVLVFVLVFVLVVWSAGTRRERD